MSIVAPTIPAVLATTVCPNCGYSLLGLPEAGICPECARAYDQTEMILYGWGRGQHESISTAKRSRIVWVTFCSVLFLVFQFPAVIFDHSIFSLGILAFGTVPVLLQFFCRQNLNHPGLIQIRLNDGGCVQFDDLSGRSALRELFCAQGWVIPLFFAAALFGGWRTGAIVPIQFYLWTPVVLFAEILAWHGSSKFRAKLKQITEGAMADANLVYHPVWPWEKIHHFDLWPGKAGSYRLRIDSSATFFATHVVDAEIRCNAEQAAALDDLLRKWIAKKYRQELDAWKASILEEERRLRPTTQ